MKDMRMRDLRPGRKGNPAPGQFPWRIAFALALAAIFPAAPAKAEPAAAYTDPYGIEFVLIPAGTFLMGADGLGPEMAGHDEKPARQVEISRPFYLGKYEVTRRQWEAAMGSHPSKSDELDLPMNEVSWDGAQFFIRRINARAGHNRYRLPTEAEWEYAARAGGKTAYGHGNAPGSLGEYAWFKDNSGQSPHPAGLLKPNAWGLYDMQGNVWEWVADWYGQMYYRYSETKDPAGPATGTHRVIRGGSWLNAAVACRLANRDSCTPGYRADNLGFRLALSPD